MSQPPSLDPPQGGEPTPPFLPAAPPELAQPSPLAASSLPSAGRLAQWLLAALALYGIGWLLWQSFAALTPFIMGLVLAYILTPFVNRLDRKMPRWLAILTVYVAMIVMLVISFAYVVPPVVQQIDQLADSVPSISELEERLSSLNTLYRERVPPQLQAQIDPAIASSLQSLRTAIGSNIQQITTFLFTQISTIVSTITFLVGFLIIPIWLFYVLNDQRKGQDFVDRMLHRRIRPDFWNVWTMIDKVFSDYIRGQIILCFAVGLAVGIGLLILELLHIKVSYILLLAIVAGITEFIPVLGPVIGAIPGILVALISAGPQGALAALVVYVVVQQLENNILVPRIVGDSVGVHPAILTVVLIAMGQVFGLLGVILSAPLTAIARDLFVYTYARLGGATPEAAIDRAHNRAAPEPPAPPAAPPLAAQ